MKNEIKTGADALSATPRTDAVRNLMNCDSIADDFSTWFEHSCALERELSETTHRLRIVEQESREMKMAAADPRIADEPSSVTIVYKITDVAEWRKTNPLRYEHHGLKAHTVAAYDAVVERNAYREELLRLRKMMDNEDAANIDGVLNGPPVACCSVCGEKWYSKDYVIMGWKCNKLRPDGTRCEGVWMPADAVSK